MRRSFFILALLLFSVQISAQNAVKVTEISTKGLPLIFLPHIGCSSEMWNNIAKYYSKNYACYLVDFAGFNDQKPIDALFTENYVKDLRYFIKEKKLKNVILVGQNYGAFVAVKTADDCTMAIQNIIAIDFYPKLSMVLDPDATPEKIESMTNSIRKGIMESDAAVFAANQKSTAELMNFSSTEDVNRFVQWQLKSDRRTLAETLCEQFCTDLLAELKDNKIPMLVCSTWFFAKKYKNMPLSEATPKLKEMYADTPNITHAVTENAKDFIAVDQPDWFIGEMDKFLKKPAVGK